MAKSINDGLAAIGDGHLAASRLEKVLEHKVPTAELVDLLLERADAPVMVGDLSMLPIAEVLQMLSLQRQTGFLHANRSDSQISIAFEKGQVRLVTGENVPEEFLLGNITATDLQPQYPSAPVISFLTAYPTPASGTATPPVVSNLNIFEGDTVANLALMRYGGPADDLHQLQFYNRAGYVDYLLDVYAVVLADQPDPG